MLKVTAWLWYKGEEHKCSGGVFLNPMSEVGILRWQRTHPSIKSKSGCMTGVTGTAIAPSLRNKDY